MGHFGKTRKWQSGGPEGGDPKMAIFGVKMGVWGPQKWGTEKGGKRGPETPREPVYKGEKGGPGPEVVPGGSQEGPQKGVPKRGQKQ